MTDFEVGSVRQNFEITLKGYTRYVSEYYGADVTLVIPRKSDDNKYIEIGGIDLAEAKHIIDMPKVGDMITSIEQLDALPNSSVVRHNIDSGITANKISGTWYSRNSLTDIEPSTMVNWLHGVHVLYVGEKN